MAAQERTDRENQETIKQLISQEQQVMKMEQQLQEELQQMEVN